MNRSLFYSNLGTKHLFFPRRLLRLRFFHCSAKKKYESIIKFRLGKWNFFYSNIQSNIHHQLEIM
jgi:hypothetical protein